MSTKLLQPKNLAASITTIEYFSWPVYFPNILVVRLIFSLKEAFPIEHVNYVPELRPAISQKELVHNLDCNKDTSSIGVDGISYKILQKLPKETKSFLLSFINHSLKTEFIS